MSLANIIACALEMDGVTFLKNERELSTHDLKEILKGITTKELLSASQGGLRNSQYFCNQCAKEIISG